MKMQKGRLLIAAIIFTVIAVMGYAQVNRDELQDLPPVVFINYEGPHARVDTREEIRQIGVGLGRQISGKTDAGTANRYFVIHCVSGAEGNKIDADVFGLGVDTGVDHVRNLRVIIQGYLQTAYEYSEKDAALLAEYITIYNAVYRGNWDYFTNRYKAVVMSNLTKEKVGLSIRYDEWPGRTLMVIPLGIGGLSSVDTSTLTEQKVVEEMRKEDDQSIPQRRDMVNLMEREAAKAEQQAQTQRESIKEEEKQLLQERQKVQEEQKQGLITKEEAKQAEEKIEKKTEDLEQRKEEVAKLEQVAEKKTEEAQVQRQEIAKDQQAAIAQDTSGVYGITIERTTPVAMGRIVRINPTDGKEIKRSPLNLVHARSVVFVGGRVLAIAGENKGQGAVRLVEINPSSLEMARQGNDDIKAGSLLWVNGNDLYAIVIDLEKNKCYIGRFNSNLEVQAVSSVAVHPESTVTIQQGQLLTEREDGSALLLNPADLTEFKPKDAAAPAATAAK
ncbi:P83/100 family protein [Treponema sp. R80B11-R83G3]